MKKNLIFAFLCFISLIFTGCATPPPQSVWYKAGSSSQEFDMERAQCNAQAFSLPNGNLLQISIIQDQCLRGKGWYPVDPKQLTDVNNVSNQLSEERQKFKRKSDELCASVEFAPIYAKTPCYASNVDFKQMADDSKIIQSQKEIFLKWREEIDAALRENVNIELRLNGNAGKKYSNYTLTTQKAESDKNNVDLYNGQITWGQYNSRRKDIYSKAVDYMK